MTNTGSDTNEEQALNSALEEATPLLAESLQRAERDHRRKRRLLVGGLVMLVMGVSIVASLVISAGEPKPQPNLDEKRAEILEDIENPADSVHRAAQLLWSKGNFSQAARMYAQAIEINPDLPDLWNGLGWCLFNTGKHEKAADAFKQALKLDESWLGALNGMGQVAYAKRDYQGARDWFKKAPQAPAAQFSLVKTYLLLGQYDAAASLSSQLLETMPEDSNNAEIRWQRELMVKLNTAAEAENLPDRLRNIIEPPLKKQQNSLPAGDGELTKKPETTNLLSNGGFEYDTTDWIIANNSKRMSIDLDTEVKAEGDQSLRLTKTGGMPLDIIRVNCAGLMRGQKINVSAKIKSENAGNAWMKFYAWDADGNVLIDNIDVTRIHGTHDWRTAEKKFIVPQNAESAAIQFWMIMDGTVWIDDVRVEPIEAPKDEPVEAQASSTASE